jgi:hypothetical protein
MAFATIHVISSKSVIAEARRQFLARSQLVNRFPRSVDVSVRRSQLLKVALELTFANDRSHSPAATLGFEVLEKRVDAFEARQLVG